MSDLTPLEREVLRQTLAGDHPVLTALRRQAAQTLVKQREFTGAGFYTQLLIPEEGLALRGTARIGEVSADIPGLRHGAGFVVYVDDGRLSLIEGFSYDEPWPTSIERFAVHPPSGSPDLSLLSE